MKTHIKSCGIICCYNVFHDLLILLIGGCMAVITFDTLEYAKNLEENGFTSKQAET
jgi:hypothetical protein